MVIVRGGWVVAFAIGLGCASPSVTAPENPGPSGGAAGAAHGRNRDRAVDGGSAADELPRLVLPASLREPLHAACGQPLGPAVELTNDQPVVTKRWFACDEQGRRVLRAFGAHPSTLAIDFAGPEFRTYKVDDQGKVRQIGAGCGTGLSFGWFTTKMQPRPLPPPAVPPVPQAVTSDVVAMQIAPDGAPHRKVEHSVRLFSNPPSLLLDGARFVALEASDLPAPWPRPLPVVPPPIEYQLARPLYRAEHALLVEIQSERGRRCIGHETATWCRSVVTFSNLEVLWGARHTAKQVRFDYSIIHGSPAARLLGHRLPIRQPVILLLGQARAGRLSGGAFPGDARTVTLARLLHAAKTSGRVSTELRAMLAHHPDFSELESAPALVWASPASLPEHRRDDDGCLISALYQARYSYRGTWPPHTAANVRFSPQVRLDGKPDDVLLSFRIDGKELEALRVWRYTADRALAATLATNTPLYDPVPPAQAPFRLVPERFPP